jgi:hypothetical protein
MFSKMLLVVSAMGAIATGATAAEPLIFAIPEVPGKIPAGMVDAGKVTWKCSTSRCVAADPSGKPTVTGCQELSRQIGRIQYFGLSTRKFFLDKNEIEECNRGAGTAAADVKKGTSQAAGSKAAAETKTAPAPAVSGTPSMPRVGSTIARIPISPELRGTAAGFREAYQAALQQQQEREQAAAERRQQESTGSAGSMSVPVPIELYAGADCDDRDKSVHPLATEICDYKDNNCDGNIDEGQRMLVYLDADGDLHGDPLQPPRWVCPGDFNGTIPYALTGNDCDDTNVQLWRDCTITPQQ